MSSYKIMIVEDEIIVAQDISQRLSGLGYTVIGIALNAVEAIDLARQSKPDLILMDIRLANSLDGIETAERINRETETAIVYLTAFSDREILDRAKNTRPYGYLIKPCSDNELRAAVEIAINKHREHQVKQQEHTRLEGAFQNSRKMVCQAIIANQSKNEFLSGMSHEIRHPASSILGFSELLEQQELSEQQREYVGFISQSSKCLISMVDNVMDLTQLEAGKMELNICDCPIGDLLKKVAAIMMPAAQKKLLKFDILRDSRLPASIQTDPTRLQQCLFISLTTP